MSTPALFRPECDPVTVVGRPDYVIYSCLQWQDQNLRVMTQAVKQTFCVMYGDFLDDRFITALGRAYLRGAMAPVKLIAYHEQNLDIFLDSKVSSSSIPAIEAIWEIDTHLYSGRHYSVAFASEDEIYSGRSDYPFWPVVKEIMESTALGISPYELPCYGENDLEDYTDDSLSFLPSIDEGQP
ncbi:MULTISPECIES: hypothetical protein [Pseudomonas]|jgi:hypothetical protein|uniref:Uncharacterized protein n=1 Tax=Pseudomonas putida (strain ATCC 47054 / DSM 6125 / CFBP 8728 / NCIMB 11950 / KT2440) TaxID=160488 RepID=Q88EP3_PSEPK|nr:MULTISPECIES: hypothetical protein [Pseudomonas]AAN69988.1 conserved protein of unknown function [Pseudomonas putida KT2440]KMU96710.1 hypothetical protein AC138_06865 [Pseudomonas putida]KMY29867.1 hypothetical protein AA993_22340 [Pseudomonas putida]MDD2081100.1 hypothetical protein [Pseudomonas putida]MDY7070338.1 hypothetical protein [Pseudomonas hunanensis]